jgi:Tol biopolymer transport system component
MMEGTAEYGVGHVDDAQTDMFVRDAVATKTLIELPELHGFGHLKPNQVTLGYKTGEMAIRFLEKEYGQRKAGKLIAMMRDHFDISTALHTLIGCDLDWFNFRFKEWLENRYASHIEHAKKPDFYGPQLTFSDGIPQFNESPVLSPDGTKIYFFSDRTGPMILYELDTITNKTTLLMPVKWKKFEHLQTRRQALSISPDGRTLAFVGEKKQRDYLYLFDLTKKRFKKVRVPFDEIRSPVFSPIDNNSLVVIGMTEGYNDLYLIDRKGRIKAQLTDNPQNEIDPAFSPDGSRIVYSGEMMTTDLEEPDGYDLFEINLDTKEKKQLTTFIGDEREPLVLDDGTILFVRDRDDQGGLGFNIYELKDGDHAATQLTNMIGGAFSPAYHNDTLTYIGFYHGEKHIYQMPYRGYSHVEAEEIATPQNDPLNEPAVKIPEQEMTYLASWMATQSSPLLLDPQPRPYRFQASTDLFIPFFFYSTLDGFVFANIYQGSDLLGNHRLQQQMQYASKDDFLNLGIFYTYARHRPDITWGFVNRRYYKDIDKHVYRNEITAVNMLNYPLDRISSINIAAGANHRTDTNELINEIETKDKDHFWSAGYSWDTITGRYLVPTHGTRLSLIFQKGTPAFGGNQRYNTATGQAVHYQRLPRESTLASRFLYGRSTGHEPQEFRLGGIDRIRAVTRSDENKKQNVLFFNNELRFRLQYLNARTKFMFPDFFFKASYLLVFNDMGVGWDNRAERQELDINSINNTAGVGITWPTFIMQTFQLHFSVQWAKRTDKGTDVWYITIGPSF